MTGKRAAYLLLLCGICMLSVLTAGCKKAVEREKTEEIMGTIVTGKVVTMDGDAPLEAAFLRAKELEKIFSASDEQSELNKVNKQADKKEVKVSKELYTVVERGLYFGKKTNGALDISIGNLIDLWGIGTEKEGVPSKDEIAPCIKLRGYKKILLNKKKQTIRFQDSHVKIHLGAIAKGYIADEMKKVLVEDYGIEHGMLSLGGNVIVIGDKADGSKWRVGIVDPLNTGNIKAGLSLEDETLVTSGNYERFFEQDGRRYHHILDPDTGYPAEKGLISTSILAKSSMDADALSTACYILGEKKAVTLLESMKSCEGVFVREDGSMVATSGVRKRIEKQ